MINVNEDINKNIISIISYTNFYKEETNITKSINSYIQEFKKAILYRVILDNKHMILFDEPTSDLDPENRKKIYRMIKYLKKTRKNINNCYT